LDDQIVDAIYAGEVIEHVLQTSKLLTEMFRVLRKGGLIHMTTPNLAYLLNLVSILRGKQLSKVEYDHCVSDLGHVSYYSPTSLARQLRDTGFTNIVFHPYVNPQQRLGLRLVYRLSLTLARRNAQYLFVTARKA